MKKTLKQKASTPRMPWQTGAYNRHANFSFILPYQFLLLCKLLEVTPEEVVRDFTIHLSCGSANREGMDASKKHLIQYFIACGYGNQFYTAEHIQQMFTEMEALGVLFPKTGNNMKLVKLYAKWRDKHQHWWFKKWYYAIRRKPVEVGK